MKLDTSLWHTLLCMPSSKCRYYIVHQSSRLSHSADGLHFSALAPPPFRRARASTYARKIRWPARLYMLFIGERARERATAGGRKSTLHAHASPRKMAANFPHACVNVCRRLNRYVLRRFPASLFTGCHNRGTESVLLQ